MAGKSIFMVIVNYKNDSETKAFLEQLSTCDEVDKVRFCVVDNTDGRAPSESFSTSGMALAANIDIDVLIPGANLGYMGAGQFALNQNKVNEPDWVILANSDLKIEKQFFSLLLRESKDVGMLGPSIRSEISKQDTNPYLIERPSREKMRRISWIFSHLWLSRIYQYLGLLKKLIKRASKGPEKFGREQVYAIHGALMIFSKNYFAAGGDFRLPCFLFNEEIFAAENCRRLELRVYFVPELKVIHREHGSMGWNFSRKILEFKKESARVIFDRYFKN